MRATMIAAMLTLGACGSRAPQEAPPTPEAAATTAAGRIMAEVPRDLGGGVSLTGAKADGRVVTLALTGMADWRPGYTDAQMATNMKRALCFLPGIDPLFASGGQVRLQNRTAAGRDLPPLSIDRC